MQKRLKEENISGGGNNLCLLGIHQWTVSFFLSWRDALRWALHLQLHCSTPQNIHFHIYTTIRISLTTPSEVTHINTLYLVHLSLAILNVLFCCFNKPHYCESGLCTKLFECNQTYSAGLVNCTCASTFLNSTRLTVLNLLQSETKPTHTQTTWSFRTSWGGRCIFC